MKKNLPFSLLLLFTAFAGGSCNTAYQSQSLPYKTSCVNNKDQKELAGSTINKSCDYHVIKRVNDMAVVGEKTHWKRQAEDMHGILMAHHLKNGKSKKISDAVLAKATIHSDWIPGDNNHIFFDNPVIRKNKKGGNIIINQVGWSGIVLDRLNFEFTKFSGKKLAKYLTISVSQKTEG